MSIEISSSREETDSDRDVPLSPDGDVLAGAAEQQLLQGLPQGGLQEQLQQGQQDGVAIADVHADLAQIMLSLHSNTFILLQGQMPIRLIVTIVIIIVINIVINWTIVILYV